MTDTTQTAQCTVRILPWADPVVDTLGHDPRSHYVETFWLPTLGPTCVLMLRHLADRFDREPDGFCLETATASGLLGLGTRESPNAPLRRSLLRLINFGFASSPDTDTFIVRRNLPPVQSRQLKRLPEPLRHTYDQWLTAEKSRPPHENIRRRARARAFILFEQGSERDIVERFLTMTGFPPRVAQEAVTWAWQSHLSAEAASAKLDALA